MRIKFRYSLLLHIFKALVVLMCLNLALAYLESPSTVLVCCLFFFIEPTERTERTERNIERQTLEGAKYPIGEAGTAYRIPPDF